MLNISPVSVSVSAIFVSALFTDILVYPYPFGSLNGAVQIFCKIFYIAHTGRENIATCRALER